MSEHSEGPGWWLASDGKWYPPESHPDHRPTVTAPLASSLPPPPRPPAGTRPTGERLRTARLVSGGAAAAAVGSFLPWVEIAAPFIGSISRSGINGGDGWISLFLGALAGFGGWRLFHPHRKPPSRIGLLIQGGLLVALVVYEVIDIVIRGAQANSGSDGLVSASPSYGLILVGLGGVLVVLGAKRMPAK